MLKPPFYQANVYTPFQRGIALVDSQNGIAFTHEKIIRDAKEAIILGESDAKPFLADVVFLDEKNNIAILSSPEFLKHNISDSNSNSISIQDNNIVWLHNGTFIGMEEISSSIIQEEMLIYYNNRSNDIGIIAISESWSILQLNIEHLRLIYKSLKGSINTKCNNCSEVQEVNPEQQECLHCGFEITNPLRNSKYEAKGIAYSIEELIQNVGYEVTLTRRGENSWQIIQGSAKVNIQSDIKTGYIILESILCALPEAENDKTNALKYLLKQNHYNSGITLSIKEDSIIVSHFIYDKDLNEESAKKTLSKLIKSCDFYDNILIDQFKCRVLK